MSNQKNIIKAAGIIGFGSLITILANVIKYKFSVYFIGPAGLGIVGILLSSLTLGTSVFSLGIDNGSIRYIAQAKDPNKRPQIISAVLLGSVGLAVLTLLLIIFFRNILANLLFGTASESNLIMWLAFGIAFSMLAAVRTGILNGLGQYKAITKRSILATVSATIFAIVILNFSIKWGIIALVISTAIGSYLISEYFLLKQLGYNVYFASKNRKQMFLTLKKITSFSLIFSFSILFTNLIQVLLRVIIRKKLGLIDVGFFQAAWNIGNTYLGIILGTLANEYYARISSTILEDRKLANQQANHQIQMMFVLSAPLIAMAIFCAPLIVNILYSHAFAMSSELLKWLIAGDVFKISSWCIVYLLLARGAYFKYLSCELIAGTLYLTAVWILIPYFGIKITGELYPAWYILYFVYISYLAYKENSLKVSKKVLSQIFIFFMLILFLLSTGSMIIKIVIVSTIILYTCSQLFTLYNNKANLLSAQSP